MAQVLLGTDFSAVVFVFQLRDAHFYEAPVHKSNPYTVRSHRWRSWRYYLILDEMNSRL